MDDALAACRALHFTVSLTLFGASVFQAFLAQDPLRHALDRPIGRLAGGCGVLAAVTSVLWLALVSASTEGDWGAAFSPRAIGAVLLGTQFGQVWRWQAAFSIALAVVGLAGSARSGRAGWSISARLSALQLLTLGSVGHAATSGVIGPLVQGVHLLATGFWLGSLVPVILCLKMPALSPIRRSAMLALIRFSNVGHVSVVLVVTTGFLDMWLITGRLTPDLAIPYQRLLALKILAVAAMIALAVVNRYWLVPCLKQDAAALDHIRRICVLVYCLGLAAIGLVSIFGMLSPT